MYATAPSYVSQLALGLRRSYVLTKLSLIIQYQFTRHFRAKYFIFMCFSLVSSTCVAKHVLRVEKASPLKVLATHLSVTEFRIYVWWVDLTIFRHRKHFLTTNNHWNVVCKALHPLMLLVFFWFDSHTVSSFVHNVSGCEKLCACVIL